MHFIIAKENSDRQNKGPELIKLAMSIRQTAQILSSALKQNALSLSNAKPVIVLPQQWHSQLPNSAPEIMYHNTGIKIPSLKKHRWFIISNARFQTSIDQHMLKKVLTKLDSDLIAINIDPNLKAYREKVQITSKGTLAGFRRIYQDSAMPTPPPANWPNHLFIKSSVIEKLLDEHMLTLNFSKLKSICKTRMLNLQSVSIGGSSIDLETESGLLNFIKSNFKTTKHLRPETNSHKISPTARISEDVILGENVQIDDNAIVIGPSILADNVRIERSALVKGVIVAPSQTVPQNQLLTDCIFIKPFPPRQPAPKSENIPAINTNFRQWPKFSYVQYTKRIADILASLTVLILFAPIFPIIALAIKSTSPGPIFFKHKRQGLKGKTFSCLKFRTMITGADSIQEKLRSINQVDGPQFKIENDPRVTTVGRFMRTTYLDEIPQFINVLLGQMSIIGPRPSPESENSTCPSWRDARLSVRPGITGLWQVCRTRHAGLDFQEWIYYDTKYVKILSMRLDLQICWKTATKLTKNFVDQF